MRHEYDKVHKKIFCRRGYRHFSLNKLLNIKLNEIYYYEPPYRLTMRHIKYFNYNNYMDKNVPFDIINNRNSVHILNDALRNTSKSILQDNLLAEIQYNIKRHHLKCICKYSRESYYIKKDKIMDKIIKLCDMDRQCIKMREYICGGIYSLHKEFRKDIERLNQYKEKI